MNIDELRRIAAREELALNFVAKDEMLSKALFQLQGIDNLILKGGTAINRVYLRNKRFSEDIDLDFVFGKGAKLAIIETDKIVSKIKEFEISRARLMNNTIRYDLGYINQLNHKDKIRLEFRVVKSASGYEKKIVNFGFVPAESALLNVYNIEEMVRMKIECVLGRLEGKDFFDLFFLLDLYKPKLSKEQKLAIGARLTLEKEKIKEVANVVNHYISKDKRPDWEMFLEELKEKLG